MGTGMKKLINNKKSHVKWLLFKDDIMNSYKRSNTKIAAMIIIILPIFDLFINFIGSRGNLFTPWSANFLSASGEGHIAQVTMWYFTPLLILLLVSEKGIERKLNGLLNVELIRNKNSCLKLMGNVLFVSGFTFVVALALNFILSMIIFHGGTFDLSLSEIAKTDTNDIFLGFKWQMENPYLTLFIYAILALIYWLSITMLTYGLGLILEKKIELYVVSLVIYYIVLMLINPLVTFQPFTEFPITSVYSQYLASTLVFSSIGLGSVIIYSKGSQL